MSSIDDVKEQGNVVSDNSRLSELLRGYRVLRFDDKNFLFRKFKVNSVRIYDRSIFSVARYGDELFTITKNKLLRDEKYLSYEENMNLLKKRGLWDENKDAQLRELKNKAFQILQDRDKEASSEKKKKKNENEFMSEFVKLYNDYYDLATQHTNYFKDTIEMSAQIEQSKGWMVSSICYDDGPDAYDSSKCLWKDVDQFDADMRNDLFASLVKECNDFWDFTGRGNESFFGGSQDGPISGSDGEQQTK